MDDHVSTSKIWRSRLTCWDPGLIKSCGEADTVNSLLSVDSYFLLEINQALYYKAISEHYSGWFSTLPSTVLAPSIGNGLKIINVVHFEDAGHGRSWIEVGLVPSCKHLVTFPISQYKTNLYGFISLSPHQCHLSGNPAKVPGEVCRSLRKLAWQKLCPGKESVWVQCMYLQMPAPQERGSHRNNPT